MSKIEWTHRPGTKSEVLNPTTGCDKVSRGCKFCYAEVMHRRLRGMGQRKYMQPFLGHVRYWPDELSKPFKWKKPRTVFLNSMSDIFHKDVSVVAIAEIYAMMFLNPNHTFIVLTKRADRASHVLRSEEFWQEFWKACNRLHDKYIKPLEQAMYFEDELKSMWPLKNVWQGVSIENIEQEERVTHLIETPAHVRVLSIEPLIGQVSIYRAVRKWHHAAKTPTYWDGTLKQFNFWCIVGGESGVKASPAHPDWFRSIRDDCKKWGVPFFFKQNGAWMPTEKRIATEDDEIVLIPSGEEVIMTANERAVVMKKVGKHNSGNILDGVQHLEFPE